jgi:hypothetical protein
MVRILGFAAVLAFFVAINAFFAGAIYLIFLIGKAINPALLDSPLFVYPLVLLALTLTIGSAMWLVHLAGNATYRQRLLNRVRALV